MGASNPEQLECQRGCNMLASHLTDDGLRDCKLQRVTASLAGAAFQSLVRCFSMALQTSSASAAVLIASLVLILDLAMLLRPLVASVT